MQILEHKWPPCTGRHFISRTQRGMLTLALALTILLVSAAFYQLPQAHAASSTPIIHWDPSMIYHGQNHNNPWGPVGEIAVVHGEGFTAGQPLKLIVVPGDSNKDATKCHPTSFSSPNSAVVGQVTVSSSGNFDATFAWPGALGQASANVEESICALSTTNNSVVSSNDDGPFTVLSGTKPSFNVSATSATAGSSITVTGQSWVPPQPLSITIANCADCDPGNSGVANVTTTSTGLNSGTFNMNIPIPVSANPGSYVVNVSTQNGTLDANRLTGVGVKQLAITAPVAATPTATATPSPSPGVTATAKPATSTVGNSNNGSSGSGNGPLMLVLLAIAVIILGIGGVLLFMYAQRRKETLAASPSSPQDISPPTGAGQFNQYGAQGSPMTPFPPGQPMNTPGQFDNAPNGAFSNQSWQDNQQVNAFGQNQPLQQGYAMPGAGMSSADRTCIRCGSPLAPNTAVCGVCGMQNAPYSDPNAPTIAY